MNFNGKIILEDGSEFYGNLFGDLSQLGTGGEVVFNTSMVGYQEILSDPSYCDQIICMTYPLIGNYGMNPRFFESHQIACKGFITREICETPSHWESEIGMKEYFEKNNLVGLSEVDTRALTKKLREHGTIQGLIVDAKTEYREVKGKFNKGTHDQVTRVSAKQEMIFNSENKKNTGHVVLYDFGYKKNILRELLNRFAKVTVVPYHTTAERISALAPDGICLSNGPGDPVDLPEVISEIKKIQSQYKVFGICLGHQLLALANGACTEKMLYGHRGANHPVKDLETGRVYMSSQNHGYVVIDESIDPKDLEILFVNVNDKTIEGIKHKRYPVFSVQFHPEASPGPRDTTYLFDQFRELVAPKSTESIK